MQRLFLFLLLLGHLSVQGQKTFSQPDSLKGFSLEIGSAWSYQVYNQLSPLPYSSDGAALNIQYLSSTPQKEHLFRFIGAFGIAETTTDYATYRGQTGFGTLLFHQLYQVKTTSKLNFKLGAEEELTFNGFYNQGWMNAGFVYNGYASVAPKFQCNTHFQLNPKTKFNLFSSISASLLSLQIHPVYGNVGNFPVEDTEQALDIDVATIGSANIVNFELGFNWLRPTKNGLTLRYNWKAFWGNEKVFDSQFAQHNLTFGLFLNTQKTQPHE